MSHPQRTGMNIQWFTVDGVDPDGVARDGGSVCVNGDYRQSAIEGGCGEEGCDCSPGHWISKIYPRTPDGVVAGFKAMFDDRAELERWTSEELEAAASKVRH